MSASRSTLNPGASAAAIQSHYDVGNGFYQLWLDRELNYSAAMWEPGDTLDTAQVRKVDYHIAQSQAGGAGYVLDVGCGWGAVLRNLVHRHGAANAVGLTLSREQAAWVRGLDLPHVEVRVESWSDHQPERPYDAIISIGAFEHFAKLDAPEAERVAGYRQFFSSCRDWLKPRGRLSLQTFAYGGLRPREEMKHSAATQFLAAEIFQETDPPRLTEIALAAEGAFEVVALRNDRRDYGRTCREWLKRLRANREGAIKAAGKETVTRYERYLQLSIIGFETGHLALYRITLAAAG